MENTGAVPSVSVTSSSIFTVKVVLAPDSHQVTDQVTQLEADTFEV